MFDIGLQEMLVIGVIALLVFGPSRLPELGRMVGRAMREFRRASDEFRSTVETNLNLNDSDPVIHTTPSTPAPATTLPSELEPTHASGDDSVAPAPAVDIGEPYCAQRLAIVSPARVRVGAADQGGRSPLSQAFADARDQGFVECPVCVPWEPA